MRKAQGYAVWVDPTGEHSTTERDSFVCKHCQFVVIVPPRADPANLGGLCKICMGLICPRCVSIAAMSVNSCMPWERKMEIMEAKQRFLKAAGIGDTKTIPKLG